MDKDITKFVNKKYTIKKCQYCSKNFTIKQNDHKKKKETYCNSCLELSVFRNRYSTNICTLL